MCCASATSTISDMLDVAIQAAQREPDRPYARSSSIPTSAGALLIGRTPKRRTARLWAKTKFASPRLPMAGRRTRISSFPTKRRLTWAKPSSAARNGSRSGIGNYDAWAKQSPISAKMWQQMSNQELPDGWDKDIPSFPADAKGLATRDSSNKVQNAVAAKVPWLLGGSADLYPSTKTLIKDGGDFEKGNYGGRNFHFGIREHAMGSIISGMALSCLRPYGATFFVFSDYMRPTLRLAAMMELPVIYIYTHDSIGLGEDGPTHQPIEHLMSIRAIPHMILIRPADANEVAEAWRVHHAAEAQSGLPGANPPRRAHLRSQQVRFGSRARQGRLHHGRFRWHSRRHPDRHRLGGAALRRRLRKTHRRGREGSRGLHAVVGAVSTAVRRIQGAGLPPAVRARVAVEAGTSFGWAEHVGPDGEVVGRDDFGASAPYKDDTRSTSASRWTTLWPKLARS